MTRDASLPSTSLEIARRLVAREAGALNGGAPKMAGVSLQRTCSRVFDTLRDYMGEDGRDALLARALARTEPYHPVLTRIRRLSDRSIHLDGVMSTLETSSVSEVTAAIEALIGATLDVLGRLIGEDMALRIIENEPRSSNGIRARAP